jgi:hypothetical protein
MTTLTVHHKTVYRYARPVWFGEHRLMFRPRDSHDLRLLDTALSIQPAASVRWLHDVFGNSIAIASFSEPAAELVFDSSFRAEQFPVAEHGIVVEAYAKRYPFAYSPEDMIDLGPTLRRSYPDPRRMVDTWAGWFVQGERSLDPSISWSGSPGRSSTSSAMRVVRRWAPRARSRHWNPGRATAGTSRCS